MSSKQPIRLVFNLMPSGIHDAAWKFANSPATLSTDIAELVENVRIAERGKLDAIFMPDGFGGVDESNTYRRPWRALDPTVAFTAIASATEHIGLVATINSVNGRPYQVARQVASLDHVSRGRAGWNVITSQNDNALSVLGIDQVHDRDVKYERAEEFVEIVHGLWESLPEEAILADPESGRYLDLDATKPIDFQGKHFTSRGILSIPLYQGNKPVIFQAGISPQSRAFGARWADALFTKHRTVESGQLFVAEVRDLAERSGRSPGDLLVLPGLLPIVGSTEAEAWEIKRDLDAALDHEYLKGILAEQLGVAESSLDLDKPLPYGDIELEGPKLEPHQQHQRRNIVNEAKARSLTTRELVVNNLTAGHRVVIGAPEQVADDFEHWIDSNAADGFAFNVASNPCGITAIVDGVVPVLQERGRFRSDYEGETFRENLGVGKGSVSTEGNLVNA